MPPESSEVLIPKEEVYVWFSSEYETSTMFDSFTGKVKSIQFGGESDITEATVTFNDDGKWITA